MNRTIQRVSIIAIVTLFGVTMIASPWVIDDSNRFLKGFVNHELLALLGVIVAITLASAAQLHLTLNQIEEQANVAGIDHRGFQKTRASLQRSAAWLIGFLALALLLVIVKPLVVSTDQGRPAAFFNGLAIVIVALNILTLVDLTQMAFKITPRGPQEPSARPRR